MTPSSTTWPPKTRPDFFTSKFGAMSLTGWRQYPTLLNFLDLIYDRGVAPSVRRARTDLAKMPPQKVLLVAVEVPGREADLARVVRRLTADTGQQVTTVLAPMEQRGKFDNINVAIAAEKLSDFDWLLVVDDDVAVPAAFLDLFLYFCRRHELQIAQPAHRFRSYASYVMTERHWGTSVRRTSFVEIGPVTAIHASLFPQLVPFPPLRYAWGLDVYWAEEARRAGWRLGVVDATPISHLRPVGGSYDIDAAVAEAEKFLIGHDATSPRSVILGTSVKV